ncbi:MAG TPA: hypothetical protein VIM56_02885 [Rhizomicrobium sp.]
MHIRFIAAAAASVLLVSGCTTVRTTSPLRSAQEELLISTAADRASEALAQQIPPNITATIDWSGFAAQDQQYGIASITDALLRHGVRIVADKKDANAVILPRTGVLSTDERSTVIGIPSIPAPSIVGAVQLPSLSIYSNSKEKGIAKFAATVYDPRTGKLITSTNPAYGFSRESDGVVLFLFTWSHNDMGVDMTSDPPKVGDNR